MQRYGLKTEKLKFQNAFFQMILETVAAGGNLSEVLREYWLDFVKIRDVQKGSGGSGTRIDRFLTGWIGQWLAYRRDRFGCMLRISKYEYDHKYGCIDVDYLNTPSVTLTPAHLDESEMLFAAGFLGISQNEQTGAVRPAIGWMSFYKC